MSEHARRGLEQGRRACVVAGGLADVLEDVLAGQAAESDRARARLAVRLARQLIPGFELLIADAIRRESQGEAAEWPAWAPGPGRPN